MLRDRTIIDNVLPQSLILEPKESKSPSELVRQAIEHAAAVRSCWSRPCLSIARKPSRSTWLTIDEAKLFSKQGKPVL